MPRSKPEPSVSPTERDLTSIPIVVVHWRDAWSDGENATDEDSWREDYVVTTVGYLVRDTKKIISVASEVLPRHDGFRSVTHIWRSLLVSMEAVG